MKISLREARSQARLREAQENSKKDFYDEVSRGLNGSLMSFEKDFNIYLEFFPNQEILSIEEPIILTIPIEVNKAKLYHVLVQDAVEQILDEGEEDYTGILKWLSGVNLDLLVDTLR